MRSKPNVRGVWAATVATLVAPMESERASGKITALVELLYPPLPDAAFTMESARYVASNGHRVNAVETGPLNRVPTYGELEAAINRWWGNKQNMQDVRAAIQSDPAAQQRLDELRRNPHVPRLRGPEQELTPGTEEFEYVEALVKKFEGERSWSRPGYTDDKRSAPKPHYRSKGEMIAEYAEFAKGDGPFAKMAATRLKAMGNRVE